ncbi:MAG: hypothetical protein ACFCBW_20590, partial [Candidatus Competibacterales bacterium]
APPLPPAPLVPRKALWNKRVYVVGDQQRQVISPVEIALGQPGLAVIKGGLAAGETLVLSDLIPAIEGMALATTDDPTARAALIQLALGNGGENAP